MEYTYQTFKYDAAERLAKAERKQSAKDRNKDNQGKNNRRRR